MRGWRNALGVGLVTLAAIACGEAPETEADPMSEAAPGWVDSVAMVANAIEARPAAADSILAAHEMSRARLDSLLYQIAGDPALTDAYQAARNR